MIIRSHSAGARLPLLLPIAMDRLRFRLLFPKFLDNGL